VCVRVHVRWLCACVLRVHMCVVSDTVVGYGGNWIIAKRTLFPSFFHAKIPNLYRRVVAVYMPQHDFVIVGVR